MNSTLRHKSGASFATVVCSLDAGVHERLGYLGFRLDTECYAIRISQISEILRVPPVTAVPRSSSAIMGIVGVRGKVLTVIDLRCRLGLTVPPPTRQSRILVLPWADHDSVGLYVDRVLEVYRLSHSDIEPSVVGLGRDQSDHVAGIARVAGELVLIVRLEQFLDLLNK